MSSRKNSINMFSLAGINKQINLDKKVIKY